MPIELGIILSFVQGVAEFLPISSSGHLAVIQYYLAPVFGAYEVPLMFDVFLHFATLVVTLCYVRKEVFGLIVSLFRRGEQFEREHRLIGLVIVGVIPAGLIGLLLRDVIADSFHSMRVTGFGFLFTALFLEVAHRRQKDDATESRGGLLEGEWELPTWRQALVIGFAQAFAILPGVSRSGSTIASALISGLGPSSAVRFSLLIALPVVFGATLLECRKLVSLPVDELQVYLVCFAVTLIVGWFSLLLLVKMVNNTRLRIFSIYTFLLGLALSIIV